MSVTAELSGEDAEDEDSNVLGKRKRGQTILFDPSQGLSAPGPSKKPSNRKVNAHEVVLDDVTPSKSIQLSIGRVKLNKFVLDLTGDESHTAVEKLVVIVNELEPLTSFNEDEMDAWVIHNQSFVRPKIIKKKKKRNH